MQKSNNTCLKAIHGTRQEILGVHQKGIVEKIEPASPTLWGTLNFVTAWIDHVREAKDGRYGHILLGNDDKLKTACW